LILATFIKILTITVTVDEIGTLPGVFDVIRGFLAESECFLGGVG